VSLLLRHPVKVVSSLLLHHSLKQHTSSILQYPNLTTPATHLAQRHIYMILSSHLYLHLGCSLAKWLVRWAAVRQSRSRFPPGTPPSSRQEENYLPRCRNHHLPSSGRKNAQQENKPRKNNVCIVREITKFMYLRRSLWLFRNPP
jgi:hypothetical protein